MTSGNFHNVPLDSIVVKRDVRQRKNLRDIDTLADSIRRLGLIHPLVVTRNELQLVTGERRYTACKQLGWTHITVQYVDELDPLTLHAIELEENVKRQDITWQDQALAIHGYHVLRKNDNPEWTHINTAEAIGFTRQYVSQMISVASELLGDNEMIKNAPMLSTAIGLVARANERREQQIIDRLYEKIDTADESVESILNEDFTTWVLGQPQIKFNFVHCDFPYGIDADKFQQSSAPSFGSYSDSRETWEKLMFALEILVRDHLAPSAHLMFWFAMRKADERLYEPTIRRLEALGWDINPMPLIWMKTDGAGILPDPERGPRQIYETALLGSRGDRKIVRAVSNAFGAATSREQHMSEKPESMLRHFFGMLVDQNTVMLDPTCGSGSSLRAAESLGPRFVQGLEINPEFCALARTALKRSRNRGEEP